METTLTAQPTQTQASNTLTHEFTLFAPHQKKVELVGSWLNQPLTMEQDEDGTFRLEQNLPDGRHTYGFRVTAQSGDMKGQTFEVADPYARAIQEGESDRAVLEVKGGQNVTTAFEWQHDDVALPQDDELVIYELHVGEFGFEGDPAAGGQQGNFDKLTEKLDYLRDLGVNALELMPIMAFPFDSWGYNTRHYCAVKPHYGTPQSLKKLIDQAHSRGMRVILDIVFNHSEGEMPLARIDFDYWMRKVHDGEIDFGGYKFNYDGWDEQRGISPAREFATQVAGYWAEEYHLDGLRLDATAHINNFDLLYALRERVKAAPKPFYLIAEHIPEDPAVCTPEGPTDGGWHETFMTQLSADLTGQDIAFKNPSAEGVLRKLNPAEDGFSAPSRMVNYLDSHDEFPLMQKLQAAGIEGEDAWKRAKLGATLLFTAVGNPMLWQGQEFGSDRLRDLEIRPVQWDKLDTDEGLHLKEHYAWLAGVRRDSPALKGQDFEALFFDDEARVLAFKRGFGEAEMLILANLSGEPQDLEFDAPDGEWRELQFNFELETVEGKFKDNLDASSAKIFVRA